MATKNEPCEFDCLANLADDEPYFTLRANDELAPEIVRQWAENYKLTKEIENSTGQGPGPLTERQQHKYDDALLCADQMEAWKAGPV